MVNIPPIKMVMNGGMVYDIAIPTLCFCNLHHFYLCYALPPCLFDVCLKRVLLLTLLPSIIKHGWPKYINSYWRGTKLPKHNEVDWNWNMIETARLHPWTPPVYVSWMLISEGDLWEGIFEDLPALDLRFAFPLEGGHGDPHPPQKITPESPGHYLAPSQPVCVADGMRCWNMFGCWFSLWLM